MRDRGKTWEEYLQDGIDDAKRIRTEIGLVLANPQMNQLIEFAWLDQVYQHIQRIYDIEDEMLERQSSRNLLLKLPGLNPDSIEQELLEAIDDVAPLFADYRRKKRGT